MPTHRLEYRSPWLQRRVITALSFMVGVLILGVTGYMLLGLGVVDAFYQLAITVTTVGYAEITPDAEPTTAYRLFTLILVVVGASTGIYVFGVVVDSLLESQLTGHYRRVRMQRRIEDLDGHIVICGAGRVGLAVLERAMELGAEAVIVDLDEIKHPPDVFVVQGDATRDEVLNDCGVERAESVVIALPSDADNLLVAISVRGLNPDASVVCRVNQSENVPKFESLSIASVIDPYEIAGSRLAIAAMRPHVSDYLDEVVTSRSDTVSLHELVIDEKSPLIGRLVGDLSRTGIDIVGARDHNGRFVPAERFERPISAGDVFIAVGDPKVLHSIDSL